MILLGEDREVTMGNAVDVAHELDDAIAARSRVELEELVVDMRQAASDSSLGADLRATATTQASAIDRFLAGEDAFATLLRMCRAIGRANDDPDFDWRPALFAADGDA